MLDDNFAMALCHDRIEEKREYGVTGYVIRPALAFASSFVYLIMDQIFLVWKRMLFFFFMQLTNVCNIFSRFDRAQVCAGQPNIYMGQSR